MLEASSVGVLETGGQQRVTAIAPSGCGPGRPPGCRSRALSMMFSAPSSRVPRQPAGITACATRRNCATSPGRHPVWPRGMNNDPTSGGANGRNTTGNADICQSAGNEGDASAGLHQHQCGVKVLDFGDGPHIHMQRVEQIEDMPTATWTTFGMSDDDILAVKIGRMKLGPTDKRMGFRERGQPLFGPHGIGDDLRAVDGWKQQAEVDPAALRPNLCDGRQFQ